MIYIDVAIILSLTEFFKEYSLEPLLECNYDHSQSDVIYIGLYILSISGIFAAELYAV